MKDWHVFYYSQQDGAYPVEEYIAALPKDDRSKTLAFIGLLKERGPDLPRPYADILEDGIHEPRIKLTGTQTRILYFFCYQNTIILTNVFEKHTDKVPGSEIRTAKKRRADFLARFSEKDIRSGGNEAEKFHRPS
ncbi:MAG: type II toxin-antitoxin system RelE/ParE family toxin [Treponema sp.]|jgi:phage-related protein|nr:type II toxin-antitoxin system RelE/ParE family toxin [Treponema sp.]